MGEPVENVIVRDSLTDLLTAARHLLDCSQASERVCSRCGGKGVREIERGVDRGRVVMATIHCDACHGTGKTEPFEVEALRALERAVARVGAP